MGIIKNFEFIEPHWPAPSHIKAFSTTRKGGCSKPPYDNLNLALHVHDGSSDVQQNRSLIQRECLFPKTQWLNQTHSTNVACHGDHVDNSNVNADACYTSAKNETCVVLTADCLPILLCNEAGDWVASVHAGWRGLADGIIVNAIQHYAGSASLMAWIGPAISQQYFEIGDEIRALFVNNNNQLEQYFATKPNQKWLCDLSGIAEYQLKRLGVNVYTSGYCTYQDKERFFSHRRATHEQALAGSSSIDLPVHTGRMATAIWIG